ncbi:hypothetical protein FACS1894104_0650 [Actinomycetota bacterium]|nr:hypothetical protein FACS1894104_0650 [Actinomycetota bacterium]
MATDNKVPTRQKIFDVAVRLFSNQGFPRVSMRDIAGEVGISAAAIYNHFPSKDSILDAMYAFYAKEQMKHEPDLKALLAQCDSAPVLDLLMQADFRYNADILETMDRIVVIASAEARSDQRSVEFIKKHLLDLPETLIMPILKRLIELKRIEPVNLEGVRTLFSNYGYAAAVRNYSPYPITFNEWRNGFETLCLLIKPIDAT